MDERDLLADRFEAHRAHLAAVAYRMLGSTTEAEDAVQETWLRLARTEPADIGNLGGWLTTAVSRVCLDMLRARKSRREEPFEDQLPDPVVHLDHDADPAEQAVLADAVGTALLVVLDSLNPAERLAFVLHDMFAVPFDRIAQVLGKSPAAAKMIASRARRRVGRHVPSRSPDLPRQRGLVEAFLSAARGGDFDALLAILDPDVVLRADAGTGLLVHTGAAAVAGLLDTFHRYAGTYTATPVLVDGRAGLLNTFEGAPRSIMAFTTAGDRIIAIDLLSDSERLARLPLPAVPRM
ncbi:sigma-70 family RNA polymerase sigma factor [Nocardia abscessus]|uniref:sigma-70 family RNA polymerase sigma factor n=1 Tax=Nocardia abscessus TaxID=120957 RepID=UPI0018950A2A|nr:sigma-70 family RNA polymerase sigma factor [Nocardia abscessus]MBF6336042.1 sigma-70 family RNA polymerase sigma factor [Nocardia abscessus]